ncbi:MAG: hypothetical protein KAU20_01745 [Nanoarchaeota archaeon]|nr:hypothetical protein [Nanoarchaeota archaeon]
MSKRSEDKAWKKFMRRLKNKDMASRNFESTGVSKYAQKKLKQQKERKT